MTDYMVRVYKENRILGMIEITKLNKKKIEGLAVYLSYSVSTTGNLGGFNTRIKGIKRIGYEYSDECNFFYYTIKFLIS